MGKLSFVPLGSLAVGSTFRFIDYTYMPVGDIYRVVGSEFEMVDYVSISDLFSPVYCAINYCEVLPIK